MKKKLLHPFYRSIFPWFHLFFGIEIIIIIAEFFIFGGIDFLKNDTSHLGVIISLGMLTFISVFFGFILKEGKEFLVSFKWIIESSIKKLDENILWKKINGEQITKRDLKDREGMKNSIIEFLKLSNPPFWFWVTIFLFLIVLLISLIEITNKPVILSLIIHLGFLSTLFFLTSTLGIQMAHKIKTEMDEGTNKILESMGLIRK